MAKRKPKASNARSNRVKILRGPYRGSIGTLTSLQRLAGRTIACVKFEPDGIAHRYELNEVERLVASH
jgi:hypothetical protein